MLTNREKELLYKAKQGDMDAFEQIIKLYEKKICQTIFYMVKNDSQVEDIAQEVFIKVYKNLSKFNEQSSLYTWIYRITMNACFDEIKKEKKVYHLSNYIDTDDGEQEIEYEDEKQNVDEIVERKLNKEVLIKAIKSLNEEYRSLIVLRDIRGFSYWEISDMLNMKLGTVKSKISRARESLKKELIKMGYSGYSIDEE
ncbi:MAG: sigma-70 family RNA polymerase sigma factor [Clostridia bacterium]|nr:sigma-70 family RNA polymerase sigma factor [Clostridia bacterium]